MLLLLLYFAQTDTQTDRHANTSSPDTCSVSREHLFPTVGCFCHLKRTGQLKKLRRVVAVFVPSGLPLQNTLHWDPLQPEGEQVCSCIGAHVVHFPVPASSLLSLH